MKENNKQRVSKKQKDILDAALKVFSEKGYDLSSMDEISEAADASKRTVYNHFESKEALFIAVVMSFIEMTDEFKKVEFDPKTDLGEQLGQFIDSEIRVLKNPLWLNFIKAIFTVVNRNPKILEEMYQSKCRRDDIFISWLHAAEEDGKISIEDPQVTTDVFWNTINGNFTYIAMGMGVFDQALAERLKPEIIELFLSRYSL